MARLTQPLGGYASPGGGGYTDMGPGRGLAPPIGVPPVNRYLGGYGQPANRLGPPQPALGFGNQVASPTLPPIGGPQPGTGAGRPNRYLGGTSQPGNTGLPPRQGDGPPTVTRNANTLPPPGSGTLPPITPGPVTRDLYTQPTTGPGSPGWSPSNTGGGRFAGSPGGPNEMKGVYLGGFGRQNMVIDPRTGKRARGAADIWASMSAGGRLPAGAAPFSFEQADAMKAEAMAQLGANYGSLSAMDKGIYDAALAGGTYDYNAAMGIDNYTYGNPAYEYDYQGNYVGTGGEGGGFTQQGYDTNDIALMAEGYGPAPRVGWQVGDWPTGEQVGEGNLAYRKWYKQNFGVDPDPTDEDGNPRPAI